MLANDRLLVVSEHDGFSCFEQRSAIAEAIRHPCQEPVQSAITFAVRTKRLPASVVPSFVVEESLPAEQALAKPEKLCPGKKRRSPNATEVISQSD
jgi:hypothetical protein